MAIINIHALIDVLGGLGVTDAKIVATASSGGKATTRNVDANVVFPKRIELDIVSGDPVDDFELLQLPIGMYWSVGIYVNGLTNFKRTVRLPDGPGPFNFDELVDVDPNTSLVDPNTEAAAVYLAEVQAAADRAEEAASGYTSYNIDGGSASSVYNPNQLIDGGSSSSVYTQNQFVNGGTAGTF